MFYFLRPCEAHITAVYVAGQIRSLVEAGFTKIKLVILILPEVECALYLL